MNSKRIDRKNVLFVVFIVFIGAFLIWKAFHGYIYKDEPFMITLGHRLLKGDSLLINEWNTTQFIGVFYVPFILLYTSIKGSMEGLILFCRLVYVVWWLFVGALLYKRLKSLGWISIVAMTLFLLYTPLDEMSLTYNAMSLSFLIIFLSYFFTKGNSFLDCINGVVLACVVLAYPTTIVVFFVYALMVIIKNIFRINTSPKISRMLSWKVFLRITSFSALIAIMLFLYLCIIGISDVISSINNIIMFPAGNESGLRKIIKLFFDLYNKFPIQLIFGTLIIVISIIDRNRNKRASFYLLIQTVFFAISIVWTLNKNWNSFNLIMIPFFLPGLQAFILLKQRNWLFFLTFVIFGVVYAFVSYYTSDTGLLAFSNGIAITDLAWIIYIYQFATNEIKDRKRVLSIIFLILITFQVGSEFYIKLMRNYWDELTPNLNTVIQSGAAKGIITTKENTDRYLNIYDDIQTIQAQTSYNEELGFLSLSLFPCAYLDMNYNYSTFSSWTYSDNNLNFDILNKKLSLYFKENKTKIPDVIYVLKDDEQYLRMIDCVDLNNYQKLELESGTAYLKP